VSAVAAEPILSASPAIDRTSGALRQPHHDGSPLYVLEHPREPGERATVRLRVPAGAGPDAVFVRYQRDGEAMFAPAVLDAESETERWWRASFPVWGTPSRYRWLLSGGRLSYAWVTGAGVCRHDPPDADDFVLTLAGDGPEWHLESVVYEIFPDRFASSGLRVPPPDWAVPRQWDARPCGRGSETPFEFFGGDLRGIEQRLAHVERLGASALFLRSMFPAGSTHRYDTTSFDRVDPLLGGDEALASLTRAAHARGLRVIGDLTANHTGDRHDWFRAACADVSAPERDFYYFDPALPAGYETWWDVATLPKLDWSSCRLRELMGGVVRRWLGAGLDGWRIDAANMSGRRHRQDLHAEVVRVLRHAAGEALLIAEHCHDFRAELAGAGWHGVMNYAGFLKPVWQWLRGDDLPGELQARSHGLPVGLPRLGGEAAEATMRGFRAGVPWNAVLHSWSLLDSCDSARFRSVAGSRDRHLVGVGLQMTLPGVPMISAGDELGLEGAWGEDGRRTMPWSRPESTDGALHDGYRRLIGLRRSSPALRHGGLRLAHVDADVIAYLRELPGERILLLASRAPHPPLRLPLTLLGARRLETLDGADAEVLDGVAVLPADGPSFQAWRLGA
jgi:alpha-glucosidase